MPEPAALVVQGVQGRVASSVAVMATGQAIVRILTVQACAAVEMVPAPREAAGAPVVVAAEVLGQVAKRKSSLADSTGESNQSFL